MDTYNPQRLPFFPTPYPGESLYSVLCRYHVRSGNATTRKTILQLFGTFGSLCSTLLLPSMLNCFESWVAAETSIAADELFRNNTAYSLCALRSFSEYNYCFADGFSIPSRKYYRRNFRQCLLQHPSDKLRYCPNCAADQKKLYGESYWQIIPQLDGIEYCPIHHTRISTTTIHTRDLLYSFFPADVVLPDVSPDYSISESPWYHGALIDRFPELFVGMAKTIAYLWEHLPKYSGIWALLHRYRLFLSTENKYWQLTECARELLLKRDISPMVSSLISNISHLENRYFFPSSFALSEHAMLITMLSSSPQAFFSIQ